MKKLCQIIEESFLQKVNQIVPAAGFALGGLGRLCWFHAC